jgi:hypothetical protein
VLQLNVADLYVTSILCGLNSILLFRESLSATSIVFSVFYFIGTFGLLRLGVSLFLFSYNGGEINED